MKKIRFDELGEGIAFKYNTFTFIKQDCNLPIRKHILFDEKEYDRANALCTDTELFNAFFAPHVIVQKV